MRRLISLVGLAAVAGCADPAPTETPGGTRAVSPSLSMGSEDAPRVLVFNTQLRAEDEIPTPPMILGSKGHAHLKVLPDGTIESHLKINNKGGEVVRFCHIHWINPNPVPPALPGTGPIIWWLTSPTGTNLMLTGDHLEFRQNANFVSTSFFATEEAALGAFLRNPSNFYVNCHSNVAPGGFIRGNLE